MVRTILVFCFLLQISISTPWGSRLFPCVSGSFRTISSSPFSGPFFISAKPYLMITTNVKNVPILSPDENCIQPPGNNESVSREGDEIAEEDIKMDEESITTIQTISAEENEINVDDSLLYNDSVGLLDNPEYAENRDGSEFKNVPPTMDTLLEK